MVLVRIEQTILNVMWRNPINIWIPANQWRISAHHSVTGSAYGPADPASDRNYMLRFEVISDDPNKRTRQWKPCQHYRRDIQRHSFFVPGSTWASSPGYGPYWTLHPGTVASHMWYNNWYDGVTSLGSTSAAGFFGSWDDPSKGLPNLYEEVNGVKRVIPPTNLSSLIDASLTSMLPGIKPKMSLLNSLWELKDLPQLVRSSKKINAYVNALEHLNSVYRANRKWALKEVLRSTLRPGKDNIASDAYLAYKFGVGPMIDDVNVLLTSLKGLRKELNRLRNNANKPLISHFRAASESSFIDRNDSTKYYPFTPTWCRGGWKAGRNVHYLLNQFNASIEYSYSLDSSLGDTELEIRAFLDYVGVNFNPRIIWAAIPWSFVVDWFIGIGRWLDQFTVKNIEPVTHITNYCWSCHHRRLITTYLGTGATLGDARLTPFVTVREDAYIRQPYVPDIVRSLHANGLDATKFSLGAALAWSHAK